MVAKLDSALFRYAGWWIKVATFFGISRWQLIVSWVYVSSLLLPLPTGFLTHPGTICYSILLAIFLIMTTMAGQVPACFRNNEVFGSSPLIRSQTFRLVVLSIFFLSGIAYLFLPLSKPLLLPMFLAKAAFPFYFWPWFCLHQSPKDPVTLRNLVGSLIAKIRKVLAPSPQPKLAPQPAAFSAPLP